MASFDELLNLVSKLDTFFGIMAMVAVIQVELVWISEWVGFITFGSLEVAL